jgi:hypothetical protein
MYSVFLQLLLASFTIPSFASPVANQTPISNRGVNDFAQQYKKRQQLFAFFVGTTVQEEAGKQSLIF